MISGIMFDSWLTSEGLLFGKLPAGQLSVRKELEEFRL